MREILPITIFAMICAVISHNTSGYDPIGCRYHRKERLFYAILTIGLIIFAGLRTGYNDTAVYRSQYQTAVKEIEAGQGVLDGIDWLKIGDNPGFFVVLRVMALMKVPLQSYIMIFSAFYIGVNLWFFRKYSCNIWLSILIYISFAGFVFSLAAIKQCTAMALCLLATDRVIHKKYIRFVLYVLVACLFHPYALMYLIVPFMFFRPWSKYTVFMLIIFGAVGFGMQSLVGTILNVTDMLGESYDANTFVGEGVHPARLMVTAVPLVLSLLTAQQIQENEDREQYVITNLTMLNAEIMFVALFGTANYFARLANYFIPFQAVCLPWLLKHYDYKGRQTMTVLATTGYSLFYLYSYFIYENFDANYWNITLGEYMKIIFERLVLG